MGKTKQRNTKPATDEKEDKRKSELSLALRKNLQRRKAAKNLDNKD